MNRGDLIDFIKNETGFTREKSELALDSVLKGVKHAVSNKDKLTLVGFGTFDVAHRKARQGRNPRTGEALQIPESYQVKFTPGKALKDTLR